MKLKHKNRLSLKSSPHLSTQISLNVTIPIQLHVCTKKYEEPSPNTACQILETFFRACGESEEYELYFAPPNKHKRSESSAKENLPFKKPYVVLEGKTAVGDIPFIKGATRDPHTIIRYLIQNGKMRNLDVGLTPLQLADSNAYQAYMEQLLARSIITWFYPENYAFFKHLLRKASNSWFARTFVVPFRAARHRNRLVKGRKREFEEGGASREKLSKVIQSIITHLGERLNTPPGSGRFFHGSQPTTVDCTIYGILVWLLRTCSYLPNPEVTYLILANRSVREYIAYATRSWFPEYREVLKMVNGGMPASGSSTLQSFDTEKARKCVSIEEVLFR